MKPFLKWLMLAFLFAGFGVGAVGAQSPAAPALEGHWSGTMGQPGHEAQPVSVTIRRGSDGQLSGTVIGPDQRTLAIDAIEQSGTKVRLVVGEIGGGIDATLSDDGTKLTGNWSEIAITTPLQLSREPVSPSPPAS